MLTTSPPSQPSYATPFVPLEVVEHAYDLRWHDDTYYRFECACSFVTAWRSCRRYPNPKVGRPSRNGCPWDPTVRSLTTLQFANGGLFDFAPVDYLIHLVRSTNRGTPWPTLCNIDRFAKDSPGWSRGGGVEGGSIVLKPCEGCAAAAREQFPGLPISGSIGGKQMAAHLGVQHGAYPR
jgi:hypothetical protein